jgi:multiple sugar transport system substrate-binding protein
MTLLAAVGDAAMAEASGSSAPARVRWFVGVREGTPEDRIAAQQGVVDEFNASRDDIELVIETVGSQDYVDTLSTMIAAGNAPDIVGPIGIPTSNEFDGAWLDLAPFVESTGFDLSAYDPAVVEYWREQSGALTGIPFAVFPSMIYYNRDLFDAAGVAYPPGAYGAPYADGERWDWAKLAEVAKLLTVDANGNDATSEHFDPANVAQWGFHFQYIADARALGSFFGGGTPVASDGSAQIPPNWAASWTWYRDLIAQGAAPNQDQIDSDVLAQGNAFNTGRVAMAAGHLWYAYGLRDADGFAQQFWDLAAVPEYEGVATAILQPDSFRIVASTANPEAAFDVLTYLVGEGAPVLLDNYGALGARPDFHDPYFYSLDESFQQGVNWQVAIDGLQHGDFPSHLADLPNLAAAQEAFGAFTGSLRDLGVDLDAAIAQLEADLEIAFAAGTP